ncbi:metallophosphoesterase, partial [Treponema saccharophilum]
MRFLHSGDWHLGKTLYDVSLEEDQKQFMEQVHEIFGDAKREGKPYDALIIPGDIYDRNVPPAKAVSLL